MTVAPRPFLLCSPDIRPGWESIAEHFLDEASSLPAAPDIWEFERRRYGLRIRFFPQEAEYGSKESEVAEDALAAAEDAAERASQAAVSTCEICGGPKATLTSVVGKRFRIACRIHAEDAPD
jgi:hypothetical protein